MNKYVVSFSISRSYFASIPEDSAIGLEVVTVRATSLDTGINAEVVYSVVGGNEYEKFAIDPVTGEYTFRYLLFFYSIK